MYRPFRWVPVFQNKTIPPAISYLNLFRKGNQIVYISNVCNCHVPRSHAFSCKSFIVPLSKVCCHKCSSLLIDVWLKVLTLEIKKKKHSKIYFKISLLAWVLSDQYSSQWCLFLPIFVLGAAPKECRRELSEVKRSLFWQWQCYKLHLFWKTAKRDQTATCLFPFNFHLCYVKVFRTWSSKQPGLK